MPGAPSSARAVAAAPWWPVGTTKFVVMTLGTLGLYQYYWLYANWRRLREVGESTGSPFWRTFFAPVTAYQLFERVRRSAQLHNVRTKWSGPGIAVAYLVVHIGLMVGVPAWLTGVVLLLPVLPVQLTAARVNAIVAPDAERNDRLTASNIVMILLGLALTAAAYLSDRLVDQYLQEWIP